MVQLALVPGALRVEAQLCLRLREARADELGVLEHAEEPSLVDGPFGFFGVLAAIPLAAIGVVLLRHLLENSELSNEN